jgi:hypothetical protein
MADEELRRRILARRAKLVAAALASSLAACGDDVQPGDGGVDAAKDAAEDTSIPMPCLGVALDATPCLQPPPPPPDDAGDAGDGGG